MYDDLDKVIKNLNIEHRSNSRLDKENPVGLHQRTCVSTEDVHGIHGIQYNQLVKIKRAIFQLHFSENSSRNDCIIYIFRIIFVKVIIKIHDSTYILTHIKLDTKVYCIIQRSLVVFNECKLKNKNNLFAC